MTKTLENGIRRRDFLAGGSAFAFGFPTIPKAAIAQTSTGTGVPELSAIVRVGIYPAIGICRVGGSDEWFLAPEVPGLPPVPDGGHFKDADQRVKKQVQRFRIYGFDDQNRPREITADEATIEWSVHLANTKAAWYGFSNPLDNGEHAPGLPGQMRNQYFVGDEQRSKMLVIDGRKTPISGRDQKGTEMGGRFFDTDNVKLGELRTDEKGRLLVLPANGISRSPKGSPITSFADNDGWYDDWCDGPVEARVRIGNAAPLEAARAWVACVGPNFAPEIPPVTTLYDVIWDLNVEQGWSANPSELSFRKHIYPTFRRLALMEWVAASANLRNGWLEVGNFLDSEYVERLADSGDHNTAFRREVFSKFRNRENMGPNAFREEQFKLPYMLGDGVNYDGSPLQWFQFPKLQFSFLQRWAEGKFKNDWNNPALDEIRSIEQVALAEQPDALTEAALEPCSGGAFHPGVELSYYLRHAALYERKGKNDAEPFRIALGNRRTLIHNVGRLLTLEKASDGNNAPIGPQMPGDLTRWMGLPWQCDAFSCQQVQMQTDFPTAVWWPALLPIDVLPEAHYKALMDTTLPEAQRRKFFGDRVFWSRGVAGIGYHANASYWDGITNMIGLWERMGFVVKRMGPDDLSGVPSELYVEVDRGTMEKRFNWKDDDGQLPR